ncbi:MAG: hypothetical protein ABEJ89_07160 [Haloarculaceae archaeon]
MRVRDLIGLPERWERRLTWFMEVTLVGMFFVGLDRGNTGILVNTAAALVATRLPSLLERDYDVALDPALALWITAAVWLHVIGTVGLPGSDANLYATVTGFDHVTHALSASVVAGVGYTTVRAIDLHADDVRFPPRFTFVFVLLFVLAFGVVWEVIEFSLSTAARTLGSGSVLTQYGLGDTILDLVFDTVGAVVVAVWGTAHLTNAVEQVVTFLGKADAGD